MILSKILLNIDSNWSIKEKVRYIHNKMCKEIKYDDRFLYSANPKLLEEIYYKNVSIDQDIDPAVVCNTANILFTQLMDRLKIKYKLIYKKPKHKRIIDVDDVACLFYDEDNNAYFTNIIGDIENCKFGLKTFFFGRDENEYEEAQDVKKISQEELFEIDKKTGLIKQDYSDIVFELLKNEIKNTNNFKKFLASQNIEVAKLTESQILEYKLKFLNEYIKFRDKTAGSFEQRRFYKTLFKDSVLDKFEKKKFEIFEYIRENADNVDIILLIGINLQTDPKYFYYSDEKQSYISIRKDDLQDMLEGYKSSNENKDILNPNKNISEITNECNVGKEK